QRICLVADVGQIVDGGLDLGEININGILCFVGAKVNGTVFNDGAVNPEWKKIFDHLQPGRVGASLAFAFGGRIDEINFRLFHEHASDNFSVTKRFPFDGKI